MSTKNLFATSLKPVKERIKKQGKKRLNRDKSVSSSGNNNQLSSTVKNLTPGSFTTNPRIQIDLNTKKASKVTEPKRTDSIKTSSTGGKNSTLTA